MDRELREAERSGDSVAQLRARLRAGTLTQAHMDLAASLGHAAARELCPGIEEAVWQHGKLEPVLIHAAELLGQTGLVRVVVAWAEHALWHANDSETHDSRARDAIAAAICWVDCPCEDHRLAADAAGLKAWQAANHGEHFAPHAATTAYHTAQTVLAANTTDAACAADTVASEAVRVAHGVAYSASFNPVYDAARLKAESPTGWQDTAFREATAVAEAAAAPEEAREAELHWQCHRLVAYVLCEVETDDLLSARQVAAIFGWTSTRTVRRYRKSGQLPGVELTPNEWRYRRSAVDSLIKTRRTS
jgi:hypothetical protein